MAMDDEKLEEFPVRLRKLREGRRIKRYVLSECCGLHSDAIRRYECGEQEPDVPSLIAIADFFDVSLDYLTGRKNFQNSPSKGKNEKSL